ncbi:MAG: 5-formyltetrahydrofolate cyclo-ligase [Oscillospiraceae bacterium]|jgi:5-formyltetrahydrofolate cyclo-ligase|nr:5-formyltetrahydrofolate cyclo-ligase [Oscillospiraceae bacterium]
MTKNETRKYFSDIRGNIPQDLKKEYDKAITDKIKRLDLFKISETILAYYPIKSEIDIRPLFSEKRIALPKTIKTQGKRDKLEFYEFTGETEVIRGIPEPVSDIKITDFNKTLAVVPGLAMDKRGYRLGYGGGFYDMFLAEHPLVRRVGVCYGNCFTAELPTDSWDIQLDIIITD